MTSAITDLEFVCRSLEWTVPVPVSSLVQLPHPSSRFLTVDFFYAPFLVLFVLACLSDVCCRRLRLSRWVSSCWEFGLRRALTRRRQSVAQCDKTPPSNLASTTGIEQGDALLQTDTPELTKHSQSSGDRSSNAADPTAAEMSNVNQHTTTSLLPEGLACKVPQLRTLHHTLLHTPFSTENFVKLAVTRRKLTKLLGDLRFQYPNYADMLDEFEPNSDFLDNNSASGTTHVSDGRGERSEPRQSNEQKPLSFRNLVTDILRRLLLSQLTLLTTEAVKVTICYVLLSLLFGAAREPISTTAAVESVREGSLAVLRLPARALWPATGLLAKAGVISLRANPCRAFWEKAERQTQTDITTDVKKRREAVANKEERVAASPHSEAEADEVVVGFWSSYILCVLSKGYIQRVFLLMFA